MNSDFNCIFPSFQSFENDFEKSLINNYAEENNYNLFTDTFRTTNSPYYLKKINFSYLYDIKEKIHSHFISFSINFCNDALEEEIFKLPHHLRYFKFDLPDIDNSNYSTLNLKKTTIRDILLSKRIVINYNKNLLEKIESYSPWFNNLFQMNTLKLFKYYYNDEKPLNKINFENEEIYLSPSTKTFYDLMENYKDYRKEIIEEAKKIF